MEHSPIRFHVSVDSNGPRVKVDEPQERNSAELVEIGSAVVRIFGRAPGPWTVAWRETADGKRQRTTRTTYKAAKRLAQQMATKIANHETILNDFSHEDRACYRRCQQLLEPTGQALEVAASTHADREQKLSAAGTSFDQVLQFWNENRPKGYVPRPVPELAKLFLTHKEKAISQGWHISMTNVLDRLGLKFEGPLHGLKSSDLNAWLSGMNVSPRTRHNYRQVVDEFVHWSKANGHLPKTWDEMSDVEDPGSRMGEIKILTPEQMTRLLSVRAHAEECGKAKRGMVPMLAIMAFAGVRHEEISPKANPNKRPLDWADIDLERGHIYISKGTSKVTGRDRIIPIQKNLAEWLLPYQRPNGPVAPIAQTSGALTKAKKAAGLAYGRNETRNVLRKSYISYRLAVIKNIAQVAEEAGNSAAKIRSNYNRPIPPSEGERWFSIFPTTADVIQLNFGFKA